MLYKAEHLIFAAQSATSEEPYVINPSGQSEKYRIHLFAWFNFVSPYLFSF
jgi:hypothetical protein